MAIRNYCALEAPPEQGQFKLKVQGVSCVVNIILYLPTFHGLEVVAWAHSTALHEVMRDLQVNYMANSRLRQENASFRVTPAYIARGS